MHSIEHALNIHPVQGRGEGTACSFRFCTGIGKHREGHFAKICAASREKGLTVSTAEQENVMTSKDQDDHRDNSFGSLQLRNVSSHKNTKKNFITLKFAQKEVKFKVNTYVGVTVLPYIITTSLQKASVENHYERSISLLRDKSAHLGRDTDF